MAFMFSTVGTGVGDEVSVGAGVEDGTRVGCGEAVSEGTGVVDAAGIAVADGTVLNVQAAISVREIINGAQRRRWKTLSIMRLGLL
jgi:hypothetical protein